MRLLLDAHISGRVVGKALIESGHDVRALDAETDLEGLADPDVLTLSASDHRVLMTASIRDFEPLLAQWAGEGRPHAGMILVPASVRNEDFGTLISGIEKTLASVERGSWADRVEWLRKG